MVNGPKPGRIVQPLRLPAISKKTRVLTNTYKKVTLQLGLVLGYGGK